MAPTSVAAPIDQLCAQSAASFVTVDAYPFDDRAGRAAPGQSGDDRQLERADDTTVAHGHHQMLIRINPEAFEGGQIRTQVVR